MTVAQARISFGFTALSSDTFQRQWSEEQQAQFVDAVEADVRSKIPKELRDRWLACPLEVGPGGAKDPEQLHEWLEAELAAVGAGKLEVSTDDTDPEHVSWLWINGARIFRAVYKLVVRRTKGDGLWRDWVVLGSPKERGERVDSFEAAVVAEVSWGV